LSGDIGFFGDLDGPDGSPSGYSNDQVRSILDRYDSGEASQIEAAGWDAA
jgi:hypothetical protein